ncbi:MAG: YncE family protein [Chloroflexota bacterium]
MVSRLLPGRFPRTAISLAAATILLAACAAVGPAKPSPSLRVFPVGTPHEAGIPPAALKLLATVAVGKGPSSVAVDPATGLAYVSNRDSDTVSVIDPKSHRVTDTIRTGRRPNYVAVDSGQKRVYVANLDGSVSVIGQSSTVVATLRLRQYPTGLTGDPTTNRIYAATIPNGLPPWLRGGPTQKPAPGTGVPGTGIVVIDAGANREDTTIPLKNAGSLAIDAGAGRLYVDLSNAIGAIDLASDTVVARKPISTHAGLVRGIAVNPRTHLVYVGHDFARVQVLDGTSLAAVADVQVGGQLADLAVDSSTNQIYVSNPGLPNHPLNDVSVIDGATNRVTSSLAVGKDPWGMAIDPSARLLYVANHGSDSVSVLAMYARIESAS